jgi:glutathionyl-hydroquinone reductase
VDGRLKQPVSNESSDIVRMLNDVDLPGGTGVDLYPLELRPQIDSLNEKVMSEWVNGVHVGNMLFSPIWKLSMWIPRGKGRVA